MKHCTTVSLPNTRRIAGGVDRAVAIGVVDEEIDPAKTRSIVTAALASAPSVRARPQEHSALTTLDSKVGLADTAGPTFVIQVFRVVSSRESAPGSGWTSVS